MQQKKEINLSLEGSKLFVSVETPQSKQKIDVTALYYFFKEMFESMPKETIVDSNCGHDYVGCQNGDCVYPIRLKQPCLHSSHEKEEIICTKTNEQCGTT